MEPDARVTGWINHDGDTLVNDGQVKFSESLDRANFRFADVNGKFGCIFRATASSRPFWLDDIDWFSDCL